MADWLHVRTAQIIMSSMAALVKNHGFMTALVKNHGSVSDTRIRISNKRTSICM